MPLSRKSLICGVDRCGLGTLFASFGLWDVGSSVMMKQIPNIQLHLVLHLS